VLTGNSPTSRVLGVTPGHPFSVGGRGGLHGERATQTSPVLTHDQSTDPQAATVSMSDQATQVVSRPHQATSKTLTPFPAPTSDQGTQVLLRAPR